MLEAISKWSPKELGSKENIIDSILNKPKIFAERILKCEPVIASITMPVQEHTLQATHSITTTIPFYMQNDFNLGGITCKWEDLVNMNGLQLFSKFENMGAAFKGTSQVTMQSEAMSLKSWKGSDFSGFNIECLFVSTRRSVNPAKIIKMLAATVLPTKLLKGDETAGFSTDYFKSAFDSLIDIGSGFIQGAVGGFGKFNSSFDAESAKKKVSNGAETAKQLINDVGMIAPLYYGVNLNKDNGPIGPLKNTTVTLNVGEYFEARELVVGGMSNISFSKEIIAPKSFQDFRKKDKDIYDPEADGDDEGYPLWGKCSLNLIPCMMMTKERFDSYFKLKDPKNPIDELKSRLSNAAASVFGSLGG